MREAKLVLKAADIADREEQLQVLVVSLSLFRRISTECQSL